MSPIAPASCPAIAPSAALDAPCVRVGPSRRAFVAVGLYLALSLLVLGGIATYVLQHRFAERDMRLDQLRLELESRTTAHAAERQDLLSAIALLRRDLDADRDRLAVMAEEKRRLADTGRRQAAALAALTDEAELARQRASLLDRGARETTLWLETAQRERMTLERERTALQERLGVVAAERDTARRQAEELRTRFDEVEQRLAALAGEYNLAASRMRDRITKKLAAIEQVVSRTGLNPRELRARSHDAADRGRGGPLISLDALQPSAGGDEAMSGTAAAPPVPNGPSFTRRLARRLIPELEKLDEVPQLLTSMPLGAPLTEYRITSPFGVRTDPITGRSARHGGLDLRSTPGSAAAATAAGRVVAAGRRGAYGILVEIDHGLGIRTRYAHLERPLVRVGDDVAAGDPVGIIGSTGRSTGRHLHYEVRLDDRPLDPIGFIGAGFELLRILRG